MKLVRTFVAFFLGTAAALSLAADFNVRDYGAVGDGVADDTAALNSAINAFDAAGAGVLYFPAGVYLTTGALAPISAAGIVRGEGTKLDVYESTVVQSSSPTNSLFTVTSNRLTFRDISIVNNSPILPTSGAGITVLGSGTGFTRVDYDDVYAEAFYNDIDIQAGWAWTMRSSFIYGAVNAGVKIANVAQPDLGGWSISDSAFYPGNTNGFAAIHIESSGAGKIVNSKINGGAGVNRWVRGIDVYPLATTTILLVSNNSIENVTGNGIFVDWTGSFNQIAITGNQFGMYDNSTGHAICIRGQSMISIADNIMKGTGGAYSAICLANSSNVRLANNVFSGFSTPLESTSVTNLVSLDR